MAAKKPAAKKAASPRKQPASAVRPCPRCGTTDRVQPVGGEPPMLVHMDCGYTFPVDAE